MPPGDPRHPGPVALEGRLQIVVQPGNHDEVGRSSWAAATRGHHHPVPAGDRSLIEADEAGLEDPLVVGSRVMRQARSVLRSASISPAVLIDAQPVGAVIATLVIPAFAPPSGRHPRLGGGRFGRQVVRPDTS